MKTPRRKIELLAPAGGLGTALAAFDAGADAVYAGLNKFNARERTENFSFDDMSRLIAYAGKNGKRVYVTLNTLLKESELPEVVEYLVKLAELRPDAVIVQDLGLLRIVREYFPALRIHASTQMGIHNSAGIEFAAAAGVKRVILERQTTIKELKLLAAKSPLELEVFVHGALCCSLSGTCLFSSWLGGWSGNRGKCKQPCRRWYAAARDNGYLFSPADLCMIEKIPLYKELGISSLKIEGRLKKADYVQSVVSAYRMILDAEKPDAETFSEAMKILNNTAGRKWSEGFSSTENFRSLVQPKAPGVWGFLIGRIKERRHDGITITAEKRFHLGDRLRLLPPGAEDGPVMTVTSIRVNGAEVTKAGRGETCFIPCDTAELPFPGVVYKIGECSRSNEARAAALPLSRAAADLAIRVYTNGIQVTVINQPQKLQWHCALELSPAQKRPLTAETVREEFSATCSEQLAAGSVKVTIDGDWFLPASVLKQCRRDFWDWAATNVSVDELLGTPGDIMYKFYQDYNAMIPADDFSGRAPVTAALAPGSAPPSVKADHLAVSVFDPPDGADEAILPPFCAEELLAKLREAVAAAYKRGIRRFRVTSVYCLPLLSGYRDLTIIASFPLPVCNSLAAAELKRAGVNIVQGWLELERGELEKLVEKSTAPVEIYRRGRPVLLATRAIIPGEGPIHDQRSNRFIIKREKDGMTRLYPQEVMAIPALANTADFYDLTNTDGNDGKESTFNFKSSLF